MKKKVLIVLALLTLIGGAVFAQNGKSTTETKSRFPQDFRLVTVNTGSNYVIGESDADTYSQQRRQVRLTRSFYTANYPVTIWEFQRVMPSSYDGGFVTHASSGILPMHGVSWFDAVEYCNRRSQQEGLTRAYTISGSGRNRTVSWNKSANGYRLLTDAEWEIACRAGTNTRYNYGNSQSTSRANFNNSRSGPTPVGTYSANAWGIYDMHGNVWEWVWDYWDDFTDGAGRARSLGVMTDPSGPATRPFDDIAITTQGNLDFGGLRTLRGGSWMEDAYNTTSAVRRYMPEGFSDYGVSDNIALPFMTNIGKYSRDGFIGFRIARNAN